MRATCVDLTDVFGPATRATCARWRSEAGPLLVPIDRAAIDLVWGASGYPSHGAYRDHHRRTARDHHPWANDGAVYDPARAAAQARARRGRLRRARAPRACAAGGLCVLRAGHRAARALVARGRRSGWSSWSTRPQRAGLELVPLDDALADAEPAPRRRRRERVTTWGTPRDLSTWSGPAVADLAWPRARRRAARGRRRRRRVGDRARARAAGAAEQRLGLPGVGRHRGRRIRASASKVMPRRCGRRSPTRRRRARAAQPRAAAGAGGAARAVGPGALATPPTGQDGAMALPLAGRADATFGNAIEAAVTMKHRRRLRRLG